MCNTPEVLVSTDAQGVQLDLDAKAQGVIAKPAAISWSIAADRRLDQLVQAANDMGANTRRNELAAALLAAAPPGGEELLQVVVAWRRATVRDVVLDVPAQAHVIQLPRYGP